MERVHHLSKAKVNETSPLFLEFGGCSPIKTLYSSRPIAMLSMLTCNQLSCKRMFSTCWPSVWEAKLLALSIFSKKSRIIVNKSDGIDILSGVWHLTTAVYPMALFIESLPVFREKRLPRFLTEFPKSQNSAGCKTAPSKNQKGTVVGKRLPLMITQWDTSTNGNGAAWHSPKVPFRGIVSSCTRQADCHT